MLLLSGTVMNPLVATLTESNHIGCGQSKMWIKRNKKEMVGVELATVFVAYLAVIIITLKNPLDQARTSHLTVKSRQRRYNSAFPVPSLSSLVRCSYLHACFWGMSISLISCLASFCSTQLCTCLQAAFSSLRVCITHQRYAQLNAGFGCNLVPNFRRAHLNAGSLGKCMPPMGRTHFGARFRRVLLSLAHRLIIPTGRL